MRYGDQADAFLKLYPAGSDEEANASQLAAFRDELAFVMRVWARAQTKTGRSKAFLFYFAHDPPPPVGATSRGGYGYRAPRTAPRRSIFSKTCCRRAPGRIWIIKSPTCFRRIG